VKFDTCRLRELYKPDVERIALAMRRQTAVWKRQKPDKWPIVMVGPLTPEQEAIPEANFKEAFCDPDRMMCVQVRGACAMANARSDSVPSARGNYGTGVLLSCVGLEQEVFPDKMPWLKEHLTREQVARLDPASIAPRGTFKRGLQFMRRYGEIMGNRLPLYCMDTQGPFDLAHLILGDDLFYAMHDDAPLVHHLMEFCLELGIRTHEWMKAIAGEPLNRIHHCNVIYAENMGIRVCEDTTAIVGPDAIREFAMPYTRRLVQHFGGAWIHYCGRNDALTEAIMQIPEVRGINFGHIPGHEHDHHFETEMKRCARYKKVYYGAWPMLPGETGRGHLKRMHTWASQGLLIPYGNTAVGSDLPDVPAALDYWYSL